jgi:hypothetical protein
VEIIHVELSHEALEVSMLEILGKNQFRKLLNLGDEYCVSIWTPVNTVFMFSAIHDFICLGKKSGNAHGD